MENLKEKIEEFKAGKSRFWDFLTDLIDNDTLIIVGLLLIAGISGDVQLQKYIATGFIGYMGAKQKYKS